MKKGLFILCCLIISNVSFLWARDFKHPCSMVSIVEIEKMKKHIADKTEPFYSEWQTLQSDRYASPSYTTSGHIEIGGSDGTRQQVSNDAMAAFYNALQWHVTGNVKYADCAARILSVYAEKMESATQQLYQYPARDLCYAAELLRLSDGSFYSGWEEVSYNQFLNKVRTILVPALRKERTNGMSSWSAGAIDGLLIAGVLLDDEAIYDEAIGYFKNESIPGSIMGAITDSGQLNEMGRDMVHANLVLDDLCRMAHVAWVQGDDLFGYDNNRLLRSFDYWCQANLGYEGSMVYTPVGRWYYLSTHNNGNRLYPDGSIFECALHHYKEVKKLDGSQYYYLDRYAKVARPGRFYHTLFYVADPELSPVFKVVPQKPVRFKVTQGIGFMELSWSHPVLDDQSGYKVYRSSDGVNYNCVATVDHYTKNSYQDHSVIAGHAYYYKVILFNYAGESEASDVVGPLTASAGSEILPEEWAFEDVGQTGIGAGKYLNTQGSSFAVSGVGHDIGGTNDAHGFVYRKVKGDAIFTVRLVSTEEAFYKVGIIMRESLDGASKRVGITLGEVGYRLCRMCTRSSQGGGTSWVEGNDFTYAPVWFRLQREGDVFMAYQSRDGMNWFEIGRQSVSMASDYYVGMASSTASDTGEAYEAIFDHVTVENVLTVVDTPQNVQVDACNSTRAAISWTPVKGAIDYVLTRHDGKEYVAIQPIFQDSCLVPEQTYSYGIKSRGFGGYSDEYAVVSVTMPKLGIPLSPAYIRAECNGEPEVVVRWAFTDEASSYVLQRAESIDGEFQTLLSDSVLSFVDTSVEENKTYYYRVMAVNRLGTSSYCESDSVEIFSIEKLEGVIIGTDGSWEENVATMKQAAVDGLLDTYFDSSQKDGAYVGYDLGKNNRAYVYELRFAPRNGMPQRMVGGVFQGANKMDFSDAETLYTVTFTPEEGKYTHIKLSSTGKKFRYLRYMSPKGGFCNVAEVQFYGRKVSLKEQTIDFPELGMVEEGIADFSPKATATSGLPVTYSSSKTDVATIVNGKIHVVGPGNTYIVAYQNGNEEWGEATPVKRRLRVTVKTAILEHRNSDELQIKSTIWYKADGTRIDKPLKGFYIQKQILSDGTVKTYKRIVGR